MVRWYLTLAIVLGREDAETPLHAPLTTNEHFWLCVLANCHLEKMASSLGNNIWTISCCNWLPTLCLLIIDSNTTIQSNYRTSRIPRYCCPNHHRSGSMFHSWNQAFRIIGYLGRFPNTNPAWFWELRDWRLIWPYNVFPVIRRPSFMIITPSFSPFRVVFSSQRFRNCSSTVDIGCVKPSSDCFRADKDLQD